MNIKLNGGERKRPPHFFLQIIYHSLDHIIDYLTFSKSAGIDIAFSLAIASTPTDFS